MTALVSNLSEVGFGFFAILALHGLTVLLNTYAWQRLLPAGANVPLSALAPMLIAGDAVNAVNPLGLVGGELTRTSLLSRRLPGPKAAVSVGLAATAQFVAQVLFVVTGIPIVLFRIADPGLRRGLITFTALLVGLLVTILFLMLAPATLARLGNFLKKSAWLRSRWSAVPERWKTVESESMSLLRQRPFAFAQSAVASFLDWQVGVVETFLVLRFLHAPVGWGEAYAIEVLSVVIEGVLFFVPARIGAQEGGKVVIFLALGLDPAKGLALGLIRRLRQLVWAVVGLAILGRAQRTVPAQS